MFNQLFPSFNRIHLSCLSEEVQQALSSTRKDGWIDPVDPVTYHFNPRLDGLSLWGVFCDLQEAGKVGDLGFSASTENTHPSSSKEHFWMPRSSMLRRLSRRDPLFGIITNLENTWRIKWLKDLVAHLDDIILMKGETFLEAPDIAGYLLSNNPSLIPQWCPQRKGSAADRIRAELVKLLGHSRVVKVGDYSLAMSEYFYREPFRYTYHWIKRFTFERIVSEGVREGRVWGVTPVFSGQWPPEIVAC